MEKEQILETLKSSFLFNFRTGNVMVDTFVTGLIIMFSTYLFNLGSDLCKNLDYKHWLRWYRVKDRAQITISGRKLQGADNTRLDLHCLCHRRPPTCSD